MPPPAVGEQRPPKFTSSGSRTKPNNDRPNKRRCISNACIACRRRKSKCDGNTPSCAACASVYHTECVYDPTSDLRRKPQQGADGATRKKRDNTATLQVLMEAILNFPEDRVYDLVRRIRTCENLEELASSVEVESRESSQELLDDNSSYRGSPDSQTGLEAELSGRMAALRVAEGQVKFIGATSNLVYVPVGAEEEIPDEIEEAGPLSPYASVPLQQNPILSWTTVTGDIDLIIHLMHLYFTYHYQFFTALSKELFYPQFLAGYDPTRRPKQVYCTPLLVNVMLSLGCHFSACSGARAVPTDSATAGDQFFREAKRLMPEAIAKPRLTNVQALALMSVREAGCGREPEGWAYSGMSFRMAQDLGLHLDTGELGNAHISDAEIDARRITFWGCFLFDKCWSNYMGRLPQLPTEIVTVPKPEVFPTEDSDLWVRYTDDGADLTTSQPSRTRAIARHISALCEISSDILRAFYNPPTPPQINDIARFDHRLRNWASTLPPELSLSSAVPLPNVLLMHMLYHTLFIHLFRPFLSRPDLRSRCIDSARAVSRVVALYERHYTLNEICNVAVYFLHSAVTMHLLTPEAVELKDGVMALRQMGDRWLVARRALCIVDGMVERWGLDVGPDVKAVLEDGRKEGRRWGLGAAEKVKKEAEAVVAQTEEEWWSMGEVWGDGWGELATAGGW